MAVAGAGNDYQKDKQFKKLNAQKDKLEVKVIRDGEQTLVENTEIVVGDLLLLDTGDKIAADGVVVKGFNLVVDEAALTGESEPLNKGDNDVWCMSGSEVRVVQKHHTSDLIAAGSPSMYEHSQAGKLSVSFTATECNLSPYWQRAQQHGLCTMLCRRMPHSSVCISSQSSASLLLVGMHCH